MSGSVLVSDITGNTTDVYVDPENNNQIVTSIQLNSREGKLLLKDSSLSNQSHLVIKGLSDYPNPVTDLLKIEFGENLTVYPENINIYNIQGLLVNKINGKMVNNTISLNLSSLAVGTYLIKVEGTSESVMFIKKNLNK
jgi:hypothetical protein